MHFPTRSSVFLALGLALIVMACGGAGPGDGSDQAPAMRFSPGGVRLISEGLCAEPPPVTPTPQREPDIDQQKLIDGDYPLYKVLEAGQNLFNNPFRPQNGHGEGRNGPRSLQRAFWNPRGKTQAQDPWKSQDAWPFLRVNGIDSQSCFECHNTIGEEIPPGARTVAEVRKPGAQGGPAPAASSAFINDQFPEYKEQIGNGAVMTKFVRNPPVVFGTGYTQRLATEMTTDLLALAESARIAGTKNPNTRQNIALTSKGVDFGVFSTICTGSTIDTCTDDTSEVVGVQDDLVIRPFQWGGIASTVRHFTRDALDFHFSVQAVEKVGHKDCDCDGLIDELTRGNVAALTSYVTMFRPPDQQIPEGQKANVDRGRGLLDELMCTDCHRATMHINQAILTIATPEVPPPSTPCPVEVSTLVNPVRPGENASQKEARSRIDDVLDEAAAQAAIDAEGATPQQIYDAIANQLHRAETGNLADGNYQIDLSLRGFERSDVPAYVWPRLPADAGNAVDVPLFSDLKVHFMGKFLADDFPQPTDTEGYFAQPGYYVTRVLWGIGDTDPYLHDGRARTLLEAIKLHGVDGSEAKNSADKFMALPEGDKRAVLDFLNSLRLPIAEGVTQPEYVN